MTDWSPFRDEDDFKRRIEMAREMERKEKQEHQSLVNAILNIDKNLKLLVGYVKTIAEKENS